MGGAAQSPPPLRAQSYCPQDRASAGEMGGEAQAPPHLRSPSSSRKAQILESHHPSKSTRQRLRPPPPNKVAFEVEVLQVMHPLHQSHKGRHLPAPVEAHEPQNRFPQNNRPLGPSAAPATGPCCTRRAQQAPCPRATQPRSGGSGRSVKAQPPRNLPPPPSPPPAAARCATRCIADGDESPLRAPRRRDDPGMAVSRCGAPLASRPLLSSRP
eukprot:CAMPEP_0206236632 /NCGR_PEP_ID=MMETSP0047_2-20121206/13823_1 /ASSEMBLY_ACC=CAM_ASM_000192 /TAXON_ID=195065 /ORGANISM="Chroomonas mesostigmatica_cf, Strain CCMP1168" /LENGTH=212 /DNA_ID=CAMNT_0053660989 /DNA_START=217 /DNA_END=853 /DNA_ORIENTATION=+